MVSGTGTQRLGKVAREFNVGIQTMVEFLHKKGHVVDPNPNAKIDDEQYIILQKEYSKDIDLKKESEKLNLRTHRHQKNESLTIDDIYETESEQSEEKEDEEVFRITDHSAKKTVPIVPREKEVEEIKTFTPKKEIKVVGKIDLEKKPEPKSASESVTEQKPIEKKEAEPVKPVEQKLPEPEKNKTVEQPEPVVPQIKEEPKPVEKKEVKPFIFEEETEEELADLLEVVRAIANFKNIDVSDVEKLRISKKKKRGGFYKRIYLESTCDQNYIDENMGCLLCVNNSCKVPTSEKMHDEYGKPAGYYCVGFKNCYVKKFSKKSQMETQNGKTSSSQISKTYKALFESQDNEISSNLILNTILSPDQCGANGHFDKSREGKVAIISIDSIDFISYKDDKILKRYRREGIYSTPSLIPTPFDIRQYKSSCCDYSSYNITYEDFDY